MTVFVRHRYSEKFRSFKADVGVEKGVIVREIMKPYG